MLALQWCLSNLTSHDTKNTLVLLYVKPSPAISISSFDAPGQIQIPIPITNFPRIGDIFVVIDSDWFFFFFLAIFMYWNEGYVFSNDVISAMEKQSKDLVRSVMKRAEAVFVNFNTNVINRINNLSSRSLWSSGLFVCDLWSVFVIFWAAFFRTPDAGKFRESSGDGRCQERDMPHSGEDWSRYLGNGMPWLWLLQEVRISKFWFWFWFIYIFSWVRLEI